MKFAQAQQVAIQTAREFRQVMHVVEVNGRHFAAGRLDMERQFAGVTPKWTVTKFAKAAA